MIFALTGAIEISLLFFLFLVSVQSFHDVGRVEGFEIRTFANIRTRVSNELSRDEEIRTFANGQ